MTGQFTMIGGRVARFTRTDGCGNPIYGDRSRIVTEGFISIGATANTDDTDAVSVPNANGKVIASRPARSKFASWTVEVALVGVHPEVVELTTGNPMVENARGEIAGFDTDTDVDPADSGYALEAWSDLSVDDACSATGVAEVGYVVFPFMQGGTVGDFTIENDAVNFTIANSTSRRGHSWGTGPYLIDLDDNGDPAALAVIPPSVAMRNIAVQLDPPEPTEGAIPLDDPDSPSATGATAGSPGAFTPPGSFRPETVADMAGVTATPGTAWTTGQHVVTQSGAFVHWTGTAWAAGARP